MSKPTPDNPGGWDDWAPDAPAAAEDDVNPMDEIAQDARIRKSRGARMLAPDRKLTKAEINAVRDAARDFVEQHDRSQKWLSKRLGEGYGAAVISNWFNFSTTREEEIARKINDLMELDAARKAGVRSVPCVDTAVAIEIWTVCHFANKHKTMAEIIGPTGVGKTTALEACERKITGCIYMRCDRGCRSAGGFLRNLACRVGQRSTGNIDTLFRRLVDYLRGTDRMLILDEGQSLSLDALDVVRDLYDEAGIPIVVAGKYDLHELVDDATVFAGQMASRIAIRLNLAERCAMPEQGGGKSRKKTNTRPLYTVDEVVKVLDLASSPLKLTPEAKQYLAALACTPGLGALRLCKWVVCALEDMPTYRTGGRSVEAKTIRGVLRKLHGIAGHERINNRVEQAQPKRKTA